MINAIATNLTLQNVSMELIRKQRRLLNLLTIGEKITEDQMDLVYAFLDCLDDAIWNKAGEEI
jgi:hypothetical protein